MTKRRAGFLLKLDNVETNTEVQKLRTSWKDQGILRRAWARRDSSEHRVRSKRTCILKASFCVIYEFLFGQSKSLN